MLLAIPFNPTLPGGYKKLADSILRYGRHPNHTLIVPSLVSHEEEALEFAMKLKDQFGRYFAVTVPDQPETMLRTSNRIFTATMKALNDHTPAPGEMPEPVMLYHDPTFKPFKKRWLDEFQAEYYLSGAPTVFGRFKVDGDTARVEGPVAINARFLKATKLIDFLPDDAHWRDFLAWEMFNVGVSAEAIGKVLPAYIRPYDP